MIEEQLRPKDRLKRQAEDEDTNEDDGDDYYDFSFSYDDATSSTGTSNETEEDLMRDLPKSVYCDIVDSAYKRCAMTSVLELWSYDEDAIRKLTKEDILEAVNTVTVSPVTGYEVTYKNYIGDKELDQENGRVVAAKSLLALWVLEWDPEKKIGGDDNFLGFDYDLADPDTMRWEGDIIQRFGRAEKELETKNGGYMFLYFLHRR